MSSPMGVPAPTRHSRSLASFVRTMAPSARAKLFRALCAGSGRSAIAGGLRGVGASDQQKQARRDDTENHRADPEGRANADEAAENPNADAAPRFQAVARHAVQPDDPSALVRRS